MHAFLKRKEKQSRKGEIFVNGQLYVSSANKFNCSHRTHKSTQSFNILVKKGEFNNWSKYRKNQRVEYPFSMHPVALKSHLHSNYFQGK